MRSSNFLLLKAREAQLVRLELLTERYLSANMAAA